MSQQSQIDRIHGVHIHPLRQIPDERGKVMHMLRCDAPHFERFGEIYFSTAWPGAIKAWHIHREMTLNYAVVTGMIKMVLYDDREHSPTRGLLTEHFIGESNYCLVTVPPMVWNGFKAFGDRMAIVANCSTLPHDPAEIDRLDPFSPKIPYNWDIRHG
jgi:dTDP-4-dehydrorhamnose 3,5-epimerase